MVANGPDDDPLPLKANANTAFSGYYNYGAGFLFDDSTSGAGTISEMNEVIAKAKRNGELIHPMIGGEDILESPSVEARRFVIDFQDMTEDEAKTWPDLYNIVEQRVKPERQNCNRERLRKVWWQFGETRPGLRRASAGLSRILMHPFPSKYLSFAFVPGDFYIASPHVAITKDEFVVFGLLQSRVHEWWALFLASSMEDRLRYTLSDCFETFPFPELHKQYEGLERISSTYYQLRSDAMLKTGEGLTQLYNRFHSPDEQDPSILELRRIHAEMDVAVLLAYDWFDLARRAAQPDFCQFLLEYEEDDEDDASDSSSTRQKKKPWRYRWPDDFRDEVLARLLELNEQRHKEELLLVKGESTESKPTKAPSKKPAKATPLFDLLDNIDLDRDERLILLIVDLFKRITRMALDEAFIAMKYPKLRKSRLGLGDPPKSVPRTDVGRDALIGGLVDRGFLIKHPSDHQQVWKLGASAPALATTAAERQALDETKAIFQKSIDSNDDLASYKEGVTDAKPGLVSIA